MYGRYGRCRLLLSGFVPLRYCVLLVIIFFAASSKATNLYIILGKPVCISGHLISFPFFAGIPTDFQPYPYIICLITDQTVLMFLAYYESSAFFQLLFWVLFVFISAPTEKQFVHTKPKTSQKPRVPHTKPGNGVILFILWVCV